MKCTRCLFSCIKAGKQQNGKQRYYCKKCCRYLQSNYSYCAYKHEIHNQFSRMYRLGCGANKMASFLKPPKVATKLISINTLQKWIGKAKNLEPPIGVDFGGIFDIDEMQTYVGKKRDKVWITYGWDIRNRIAVALHVGGRSSEDLEIKILGASVNTKLRFEYLDSTPGWEFIVDQTKVAEAITNYHQLLQETGNSKWNKMLFKLYSTGKFDINFQWDQALQDEYERNSRL